MAGRFSLQTAQISCGDISAPGGRQMYVVYYSDVKLQALPGSGGVCTQIMIVVNLTFGNLGFPVEGWSWMLPGANLPPSSVIKLKLTSVPKDSQMYRLVCEQKHGCHTLFLVDLRYLKAYLESASAYRIRKALNNLCRDGCEGVLLSRINDTRNRLFAEWCQTSPSHPVASIDLSFSERATVEAQQEGAVSLVVTAIHPADA